MPDHPVSNPRQFIQAAAVLHVVDVEAAARYYRERLGFTHDFGDAFYAVVWRDNAAIHFRKAEHGPSGVHLFLWVRDVDAYHAEIVMRGLPILWGPADQAYGLREFALEDLNGVVLVFGQDRDPGTCA